MSLVLQPLPLFATYGENRRAVFLRRSMLVLYIYLFIQLIGTLFSREVDIWLLLVFASSIAAQTVAWRQLQNENLNAACQTYLICWWIALTLLCIVVQTNMSLGTMSGFITLVFTMGLIGTSRQVLAFGVLVTFSNCLISYLLYANILSPNVTALPFSLSRALPLISMYLIWTFLTYISADIAEQSYQEMSATNQQLQREIQQRQASEQLFRDLYHKTPIMLHSIDQQGYLVDVNDHWLETLGYSRQEVLGRRSTEFLTPESQQLAKEVLDDFFRDGYTESVAYQMVRRDGTLIDVLLSATALFNEQGTFVQSRASLLDVTAQKSAEAQRLASEQRFRAIFDQTNRYVGLLDIEGRLIEANERALLFSGIDRAQIVGKRLIDIYDWPDNVMPLFENISRLIDHNQLLQHTFDMTSPQGETITVDTTIIPIYDEASDTHLMLIEGNDVTDLKLAQAGLERSLAEKDALLREIHHRVKNNLQIVSSMLRLHQSKNHNLLLTDLQQRIRTMTLIHEQLYGSQDLAHINFGAYLETLSEGLVRAYGRPEINLSYQFEPVLLNIDRAITLGLIVNELITNAFKHAFPNDQAGNVSLQLKQNAESIELVISDNGVGLPNDFDLNASRSLGWQLIRLLKQQIDASLTIEPHNGTQIVIRISGPSQNPPSHQT